MPLRIEQKAKYTGHDHWTWSVWLAGTPTELRRVAKVRYLLHPTFIPPTRWVEDRSTKFRLDASGWGEFRIRADVHFTDGNIERLEHDLKLAYPAKAKEPTTSRAATKRAVARRKGSKHVPTEERVLEEPQWFWQELPQGVSYGLESTTAGTAHVTFIHGIANKPSAKQLLELWLESLREQNGIDLMQAGVSVSMVYWADVLYADPLTEMVLEAADEVEMPGLCPSWESQLSPQEQFFVESLRGRLYSVAADDSPENAFDGSNGEERVPLPWPIKRPLMERLLRDVHHYLFNVEFSPRPGVTYKVRDEIRRRFVTALQGVSHRPHVVVSHSMGTVIAYDCLMRVSDCPAVDGLMTIGSPLGLDEIQDLLRPEWTRGNGFPSRTVTHWVNVYDRLDPVCGFDPELSNDFQRARDRVIEDIEEPNSGWWRHDIAKYLRGPRLRNALQQMVTPAPTTESFSVAMPPDIGSDFRPALPEQHTTASTVAEFAADEFLAALGQALDAFQHDRVQDLCDDLLKRLSQRTIMLKPVTAVDILYQLRRKRKFGQMRRVTNALLQSGHDAPRIRRLYVQSLLDEGDVAAGLTFAEDSLHRDSSDAEEVAELRGLIGRAYKQWYVGTGDPKWLRRAVNAYYAPFDANPAEHLWHGINVVGLLARAVREGIDVSDWRPYKQLAQQVLDIIAAQPGGQGRGYWDRASAMEACLALNRKDEAARWARAYVDSEGTDAFEVASTLRQLKELWQLTPEQEPGNVLLPLLEAALLTRTGSELTVEPQVTTAAHLVAAAQSDRLQKVLGFDTYQPLKWLTTALERSRSVGRLQTATGQAVGTGFVLRGRDLCSLLGDELLLLTNAHVLGKEATDTSPLSEMHAYVNFQYSDDEANRCCRLGRVVCTSPYAELDFTLVRFDDAAPSDVQPFPISFTAPRADGQCRLNAIGHPKGGDLALSIRDNLLIDFLSPRLHYRTPTDPGSSGSPILDDQWNLIALHHAGDRRMPRLRGNGFYEANEGIWITAIREEIERQLAGTQVIPEAAPPLVTSRSQPRAMFSARHSTISSKGRPMNPQLKQTQLQRFLREVAGEDRMESLRSEAPLAGAEAAMERFAAPTSPQPTIEDAQRAVEKTMVGAPLNEAEMFSIEAIVLPRERPVVFIENNTFETPESPWTHFATDPQIKGRLEAAIRSIGRVELPDNLSIPFGGTAFVVGRDLLMTNRHVAELFSTGLGTRNLAFRTGQSAGWDPRRERNHQDGDDSTMLEVKQVVMIHPYWDMALLRVAGLTESQKPLELAVTRPEDLVNQDIAVIGYPAKDWRNDSELQDFIFKRVYNVKRLQPGKVKMRAEVQSFNNRVSAMTHDSSTLGGNSGSALINAETGQVVGLHFAGRYLLANFAVPTFELARDRRVVDLGVNFVDRVAPSDVLTDVWRQLEQERAPQSVSVPDLQRPAAAPTAATVRLDIGNLHFALPVQVTLTPPTAGLAPEAVPTGGLLEGLKTPVVFPKLDQREGYNPAFLELSEGEIPLPALTPQGEKVVARLDDGTWELKYHKFSIVMHKKRRMALFTAANVDWRDHVRKINGRKPTRKELTGIPDGSAERWVTDERIPENQQLPDEFYTKDGGNFDKGHLVRRDDVCWGSSFKDIQKANGDTYHTTNCSPQVSSFNQSSRGQDNWGDLENLIQSETGAERVIIFSGPVLSKDDLRFEGVDKRGDVQIQIPSAYWKIVVAKGDDGPQAFGFVLEQDLADVPLEFAVPARWRRYLRKISEIETLLHGLASLSALTPYDQYDSHRGRRLTARLRK